MSQKYSIQAKGKIAYMRITGDISWWRDSSERFIREVDTAIASGATSLDLYVNSGGGDVFEGNEMANQIKRFTGHKIGRAGALCASIATALLLECDETEIAPNGQYMIHNAETGVRGDKHKIRSRLKMLENAQDNMRDRYSTQTGISKEEIDRMMNAETWMSAEEAVEKGFIDRVAGEADTLPEVSNSVLNSYKHPVILNQIKARKPDQAAGDKKNHSFMKSSLTEILGLAPSSSDEQVINAIRTLKQEKEKAVSDLATVQNKAKRDAAEMLVDAAIEQKKIPQGEREQWIADAVENTAIVKRTIERIPLPVKLSNQVNDTDDKKKPASDADSFSARMEKDPEGMMKLREEDPSMYARLYEKEFGEPPVLD